MADYPSSITSFVIPKNNDPLSLPNHVDYEKKQSGEIVAIETELGLGLKGTKTTLAERLSVGINPDGTLNPLSVSNNYLITTTSITYTITETDELIVCNSATNISIYLPLASGSGREIIIKNINTGIVNIEGSIISSGITDTIDEEPTQELYQYESVQIIDSAISKWTVI